MAKETQVLVVGAGPTGPRSRTRLTHLGVAVRIIDKTAQPGTTSRALVMHARILELYDQLGWPKAVIAQASSSRRQLWVAGKHVARAPFGDMGEGFSPYPFALIYPQDAHEKFLVERLHALGVEVERTTELVSFEAGEGGVRANLRRADGSQDACECAFIAGCDGAHTLFSFLPPDDLPSRLGMFPRMIYIECSGLTYGHNMNKYVQFSGLIFNPPSDKPASNRRIFRHHSLHP